MAEERSKRRLAAILAADVVGYSRLMGLDEAGTLAALKARRKDTLQPIVADHAGRIFKLMGDGVLVEFASAVDAVECAMKLQEAMAAANVDVPEDRQIVLRIGVNVGDVIVEGADLYGDGVNVAARLEGSAEPGGIQISGSAYEQVRNKIGIEFDDIGALSLKNISVPVRVYRLAGVAGMPTPQMSSKSEKPSIALLPFVNMSDDPAQDYFADGITDNIITGLSRFRDLLVTASNSSFAYKGKATKVQNVSGELGVRYILEGSVQRSKDRVRVTAQLIDGKTGQHLWAERYDRQLNDIFAVQDEVTERIVGSLATAYGGRLRKAWQSRPEARSQGSFQAFDLFLRGMDHLNRFNNTDNNKAKEFFEQATLADPNYAKAYAKLAWAHMIDANEGWGEDPVAALARGQEFALRAIERDDDEAWGHYALGGYYLFSGQHEQAVGEFEHALRINPNDADVFADYAYCLSYAGRANDGLEAARRAMRLNPHYPEWYVMQLGQNYFDCRQYGEAIEALTSIRKLDTTYIRLYLAASHAAMGHDKEARQSISRALELDPAATLSTWTRPERAPYKNPSDLAHFRENLRLAGLPS